MAKKIIAAPAAIVVLSSTEFFAFGTQDGLKYSIQFGEELENGNAEFMFVIENSGKTLYCDFGEVRDNDKGWIPKESLHCERIVVGGES